MIQHCGAIFVCPPGENAGGDLIRKGALKFLAWAGLDVWESDGQLEAAAAAGDQPRLREFLSSYRGLIFFTGGGNLGIYLDNGEVRRRVIDAASVSKGILVFPQSGVTVEPSLRDGRVTVWARDANSYAILKAGGVKTELVPDASLYLDPELPKHPGGTGTFFIRRLPGRDQEYCNYDLDLDQFPSGDPTYRDQLEMILQTIMPFRSVLSDRLHGSLISLMLRKRVGLLPGSYLKSKSFYETWLRGVPGVCCVQDREQLQTFLKSDLTPELDLRALFLSHAVPALNRFIAGSRGS